MGRGGEKSSCCFEQLPDFLRIKPRHIFLFGADVYQTALTPTLLFNGVGVMCAPSRWKLLLLNSNTGQNTKNSIVWRRLGTLQPACDSSDRVALPVSCRTCSARALPPGSCGNDGAEVSFVALNDLTSALWVDIIHGATSN